MNIIHLLVSGLVLTILATITLAAVSYAAFRIRKRRRPFNAAPSESDGPLFFEPVRLPATDLAEEEE
jgi:hypothetical protein